MKLVDAEAILRELNDKYNKAALYDDAMSCGECEGLWSAINLIADAQRSAWKAATIKPKTAGKYLALWSLTEKGSLICTLLNYGTFEDRNDGLTEKLGWWEFDTEYGVTDFTDNVRYWTELPDMPEVDECD